MLGFWIVPQIAASELSANDFVVVGKIWLCTVLGDVQVLLRALVGTRCQRSYTMCNFLYFDVFPVVLEVGLDRVRR